MLRPTTKKACAALLVLAALFTAPAPAFAQAASSATAQLTMKFYIDYNENGKCDSGELGCGYTFTLYGADGAVQASRQTNQQGLAMFTAIPTGAFFLRVQLTASQAAVAMKPSDLKVTVSQPTDAGEPSIFVNGYPPYNPVSIGTLPVLQAASFTALNYENAKSCTFILFDGEKEVKKAAPNGKAVFKDLSPAVYTLYKEGEDNAISLEVTTLGIVLVDGRRVESVVVGNPSDLPIDGGIASVLVYEDRGDCSQEGIGGVAGELLEYKDGIYQPMSPKREAQTDASGFVKFPGLQEGYYKVQLSDAYTYPRYPDGVYIKVQNLGGAYSAVCSESKDFTNSVPLAYVAAKPKMSTGEGLTLTIEHEVLQYKEGDGANTPFAFDIVFNGGKEDERYESFTLKNEEALSFQVKEGTTFAIIGRTDGYGGLIAASPNTNEVKTDMSVIIQSVSDYASEGTYKASAGSDSPIQNGEAANEAGQPGEAGESAGQASDSAKQSAPADSASGEAEEAGGASKAGDAAEAEKQAGLDGSEEEQKAGASSGASGEPREQSDVGGGNSSDAALGASPDTMDSSKIAMWVIFMAFSLTASRLLYLRNARGGGGGEGDEDDESDDES